MDKSNKNKVVFTEYCHYANENKTIEYVTTADIDDDWKIFRCANLNYVLYY
jgi:hypothetical protein